MKVLDFPRFAVGFCLKNAHVRQSHASCMQRFEKVEVGSTNCHLGAACSDQDDDYNGEDSVMSKARDTQKPNDKKKPQKTLKEKRQLKREKKSAIPTG